jgi:predicted nucleic acid-binding protein
VAEGWAEIGASAEARGKHLRLVDGLLTATAIVRGFVVVT